MTRKEDAALNGDTTVDADSEAVISGAALISGLGSDRAAVWRAVVGGQCAVRPLTAIEAAIPAGSAGAEAPPLDDPEVAGESREVRYLRRAIGDAFADAGFARDSGGGELQRAYPTHRRAIVLGTTLHGMRGGGEFLRGGDAKHLRTFLAAAVIREAIRGLGIEGPAITTCSACSSSLGSVALGVTMLQSGLADLVVAGGYDPISEYAFAGFSSLRLVASNALRPFARDRDGMKLGEGYGIVILEREDDLLRRGRSPLARILGFGESADAHHLTQPHPAGDGAARAISAALQSAGLMPAEIDLIAAHATGTPDNDAAEYAALRRVFGDELPNRTVVAFKSHLAHTLGGAGAVELILSATALAEQIIPPCANIGPNDSDFAGLSLATGAARPATIGATMNLSLGFGGANTCVILGTTKKSARRQTPHREVLITGIGVAMPGAMENEAFLSRLDESSSDRLTHDASAMDDEAIEKILSARRIRRMSAYVKLSLVAATLALADGQITDVGVFCESASAILGTAHAGAQYCVDYYSAIVRGGLAAANPMLFAEGVPNAAAAHLSLATGMKGGCQTIIGSRTAGLDALGLAAARIAGGLWNRAVVVAADEYCPVVNSSYAHCGLYAPDNPAEPFSDKKPTGTFVSGWGAAALILESRSSFEARGGAKIHGSFLRYAAGTGAPELLARTTGRVLGELGDPSVAISSANGTWLDRAEAAGLAASAARSGRKPSVSSLCGHFAECFSAGPLVAVAGVLLSRRLPSLLVKTADQDYRKNVPEMTGLDFAALASDYNGMSTGALIRLNNG